MDIELSKEKLDEVTQLAGLFYTPKQVAIIADIRIDEMKAALACEDSQLYRAYWKGYYEAEMQFRTEVKKNSNFGSSPAQTLLAKIIEQHKIDLIGE